MGIRLGKLGSALPARRATSGGRVGGFIPPSRNVRQTGRQGSFAGRGNQFGAAQRPTDINDIFRQSSVDAWNQVQSLPAINYTDEPTFREGLESAQSPWGEGEILWSGSDPVHPQDCELWPDSPYCGGSVVEPLRTLTVIDFQLSFEVSPTEILVCLDPSLLGMNFPPGCMGYRTEDAQQAAQPTSIQLDLGTQTWGSIEGESTEWIAILGFWFGGSRNPELPQPYSDSFPVFIDQEVPEGEYETIYKLQSAEFFLSKRIEAYGPVESQTFWGRVDEQFPNPRTGQAVPGALVPLSGTEISNIDFGFSVGFGIRNASFRITRARAVRIKTTAIVWPFDRQQFINGLTGAVTEGAFYSPNANGVTLRRLEAFVFNPFRREWQWWPITQSQSDSLVPPENIVFSYASLGYRPPPPPPSLPPNSPALQPDEPMACDCKKIEKCLAEIKKALGTKLLPWNLPENLGTGEGTVEIDNYAELQLWHFNQLSSMLGQTKIKVKVKDTDLTEEGDQELEIEFENLSEAIAELAGLALTNQAINSATLNASLTSVVQAGMAFTTSAVIDKHVEEIIEYLGFAQKRSSFEVPLAYTPGESVPDQILKDSKANLSYWENVDRRTMQSHSVTMEHAAAIIRAVFWERIGSGASGVTDVSNNVKDISDQVLGDFDTFLENVEQGFSGAPGATDLNPYGRSYQERPRIRKIGGRSADDGSNT